MNIMFRSNCREYEKGVRDRMDLEGINSEGAEDHVTIDDYMLPLVAAEALGYDICKEDSDFFISVYFNGSSWEKQVVIFIPIKGMMNGNLGCPVYSGIASRYVEMHKASKWVDNPRLIGYLKELEYEGFVSLGINIKKNRVCFLNLGIPFLGLFNIIEGIENVRTFLESPSRYMESWAVNILVSVYPFPHSLEFEEEVSLLKIEKPARKHIWVISDNTKLCCVTAWGRALYEAGSRALRTCDRLPFTQTVSDGCCCGGV